MPHIRPLEGKLWEMRMKGKDGIARELIAARLESGKILSSLRTMIRYAKATGGHAVVKIEACE